jgi:hypothetical protein
MRWLLRERGGWIDAWIDVVQELQLLGPACACMICDMICEPSATGSVA